VRKRIGEFGDRLRRELRHHYEIFRARWSRSGTGCHRNPCRSACPDVVEVDAGIAEAILHAVSSQNMSSQHGFDARISPYALHVPSFWGC